MKKTLLAAFVFSGFLVSSQKFDQAKLDTLLLLIEENGKGMGSLSIAREGKEVYQKSIGYSSIANNTKANKETIYRIGSISKTFTSTMIMQLIEEEKLTLSTTLSTYFPDITNSDEITIEHLLRHRSGIFNITDAPDFAEWMTEFHTKDQLLSKIKNTEPVFKPGAKGEYSNTNYLLLTFIIEKIEGRPYSESLEERIIKPCNLMRTSYGGKIDPTDNQAYSYYRGSNWELSLESDMSIPQGAGGIISTPSDLNKFLTYLFDEKLVSNSSLNQMKEIKENFGLGLLKVPFYTKRAFGHNGGIDSFRSMAYHFPKENLTVTYISNGTVLPINDILIGVLSIYFGMDYELPKFKQIDEEILKKYEGTFISSDLPLDIVVFVKGGILKAQATGQSSFSLEAINETEFQFSQANIKMTFKEEGDAMKFEQNGRIFEMKKN